MKVRRKLIEVALPLDAINKASAREKSIRHGHPSTLHLWWARRPLAAARAVIFAQMVDDPSANPDLFPTEASQEEERQRLFRIIEKLVLWENTTNEEVLQEARDEIWQSWRRTCAENADHPRADELFNRDKLPAFHDPFAGGGSLPLEAQRLGLEAHASDLNPVAVLINKAMIEIPPKFAGKPPVNPDSSPPAERGERSRSDRGGSATRLIDKTWRGAEGLAEDVRYYGQWMRDEAERRIGHLYPKVLVTEEMAADRPDLEPYVGRELTVIAWLWARTVKSPNPAFADVDVPLASTFILSKKKGREAWVEPVIDGQEYWFAVKAGRPPEAATRGTRNDGGSSGFSCLLSGTPMTFDYLRSEAKTTGLRARLMAVVAEGDRGRVFLTPPQNHEQIARIAPPENVPESDLPEKALGFRVQEYAMTKWRDLFTDRQLAALTTFSDLVSDVHHEIRCDATTAGLDDDGTPLFEGGFGASAYADAIKIFLAFAASKAADSTSKIAWWQSRGDKVAPTFTRQAISMVWDYAEVNPLSNSTRNWIGNVQLIAKAVASFPALGNSGTAYQSDAAGTADFASEGTSPSAPIISTDPPYYDNIGYADLSEFFYVWLRRTLRQTVPDLFARLTIPKDEELIATPFRHASKDEADDFFLTGMSKALARLSANSFPDHPLSIYYAYKQAETTQDGVSSSGWETFLAGC